jgi:YVTN family beta-propeller protein
VRIKFLVFFVIASMLLSACSSLHNHTSINKAINSLSYPFFTSSGGNGAISTIDLSNFTIANSINLSSSPMQTLPNLIVDSSQNLAYIELPTQLETLNLQHGNTQLYNLAKLPTGIVLDPNPSPKIYTIDNLSAQLVQIDPITGYTTTYPINFAGAGLVMSPNYSLMAALTYTPFNTPAQVYFFNPNNPSKPIGQINVGTESQIQGLFSPDGSEFYVLETSHGNVPGLLYPINLTGSRPSIGSPVAVGQLPRVMAISPNGQEIAVVNAQGSLIIINTQSMTIQSLFNLNFFVNWMSFSADSQTIYVATVYPSAFDAINSSTGQITKSVNLPYQPSYFVIKSSTPSNRNCNGCGVSPNYKAFILYDNTNGTVYSIKNLSAPVAIKASQSPLVVVGKVGQPVWIINTATDNAQLYSNGNLSSGYPTCVNPTEANESPDGNYLYITCDPPGNGPGILQRLSTSGQSSQIQVGHYPTDVGITPNNSEIFVTNALDNNVSIIKASSFSLITTIPVGSYPTQIVVSPDSRFIYVLNSAQNTLSKISTTSNKVINTLAVGSSPYILPTPDGSTLWVINQADGTMESFSTQTNVLENQVSLSGNPVAAAVTPDGKYLLIIDDVNNDLQMYSATSGALLNKVSLKMTPTSLAVTPDGSFAICADEQSGIIVVVSIPNLNIVNNLNLNSSLTQLQTFEPNKTSNYTTTTGV